jgi:hypothetical protein
MDGSRDVIGFGRLVPRSDSCIMILTATTCTEAIVSRFLGHRL